MTDLQNYLGGAFGDLEGLSVWASYAGLGALADRVEWYEIGLAVLCQNLLVIQASQHSQVDRIAILFFGSQCPGQNQFLRLLGAKQSGFAQGELILGQSAGLIGTQDIHPRHLFDRLQFGHNSLHLCKSHSANCHSHREHCRHGNRDSSYHQDQHKLDQGQQLFPSEEHHQNQRSGQEQA